MNKENTARQSFAKDVKKGLTDTPKHLSSKYIYDEKGDQLFQQIMELPEYYLTRCEFDILTRHTASIANAFSSPQGFDLIELGAGDGKKTKILLRHLVQHQNDFTYIPTDISQHILDSLTHDLTTQFTGLDIKSIQGSYTDILQQLGKYNHRKKVILVLGSSIGNLPHQEAVLFLKNIQLAMHQDDMLFIGFDQKKDPQIILNAYNDVTGITAAFNKNLLARINKELEGDFILNNFMHWETYNPETGTAKSFLVSKIDQEVHIKALSLHLHFKRWETIHTEISQKYDPDSIQWLTRKAGLHIAQTFADPHGYYKNYILEKKNH